MERPLKPYDKECMKMAILKHEQTFKEQVYELHRLYRIQKSLMSGVDRERLSSRNGLCSWQINDYDHLHHRRQFPDQRPRMALDLERQPGKEYYILRSGGGDGISAIREDEIELTLGLGLGPSSYNPRKKAGTPDLTSDSGRSFSSSSTGSSHTGRGGAHEPRSELSELRKEHQQQPEQQPPWLFQVLSLNLS